MSTLTPDQLLRKQCLEWAFETRKTKNVPHMSVVNVAQEYYDFICHAPSRLDFDKWWAEKTQAAIAEYQHNLKRHSPVRFMSKDGIKANS